MPFQLRNRLNQAVPVHLKIGGKITEVRIPPKKVFPKDADNRLDDRECYEDHEFTPMAQTLVDKRYISKHDVKVKPVVKLIPKPIEADEKETSEVVKEEIEAEVCEEKENDGVDVAIETEEEFKEKPKAASKKKTTAKPGKNKKN